MKRHVKPLGEGAFDLLILGGGITGAGVALDAVLRGMKVALIDKGDFASGTSSVSSKLVHGGLRYLEHAAFHLVYEALHERRLLLRNAPHLVYPLKFAIPFYEGSRVPPWKWRAGLTLYDFLAGRSNLRRNRVLSERDAARTFPWLKTVGLHGGAVYFDAQMDDARLCLDVLQTAAHCGACVINYAEALAFEQRNGRIAGVRVLDHLSGEEFSVRARQVLNATGPWVDTVCRLAGDDSGPHLRPTKGVHLVVPDRGLTAAFLLLHPADGRVFFVIPWMGKTLIGTTDTLYDDRPETLAVTAEDTEYLLAGHNHHLQPALAAKDILGSFAGLRPLIRTERNEPSSLSREFRVFWSPSGLLSVAGGKYTTYRRMAETVTDMIARRLGRRRPGQTKGKRLDGAPEACWEEFLRNETASLCAKHRLEGRVVVHLLQRYGRRAADVAAYLEGNRALARPIIPGEPDILAEFVYHREEEMAVFPADYLLRRTRLGLFHPEMLQKPFATWEGS